MKIELSDSDIIFCQCLPNNCNKLNCFGLEPILDRVRQQQNTFEIVIYTSIFLLMSKNIYYANYFTFSTLSVLNIQVVYKNRMSFLEFYRVVQVVAYRYSITILIMQRYLIQLCKSKYLQLMPFILNWHNGTFLEEYVPDADSQND